MSRERKRIGGPEKLAILKRYLVEKVPVSDLCDQYGVQPSQVYYWQAQLFEHGAGVFERKGGRQASAESVKDRKIERLESTIAQKELKLAQKNEVISELMEENVRAKKANGELAKGVWVPHDTRDAVVDYVKRWTKRTDLSCKKLLGWLELSTSKFHQWQHRYGRPNEHNGRTPRDGWLAAWEKQAILDYHTRFPLEGYRRLAFMMLDDDLVAVSPSSVYRVLKQAGRLDRKWQKPSQKGTGFTQPLAAHDHWHVDISYLNLGGTFYYLCSILDGYSRFIVHWEIRARMTEGDVETIVQRGLEKFPGAKPRIISDNGPQFIARDFQEFIRLTGTTHVRTSPYYPQSNGKKERWFGTLKGERFRLAAPQTLAEARRVVASFVAHYNDVRLHSALGYITPADKLAGLEAVIFAERDRKLEAARALRRQQRAAVRCQRALPIACEKEPRERLAGVQGAGNEATWSPEPLASLN